MIEFFNTYFFGYFPIKFRKIIRTVCILLLAFVLFEVAVKFLICIIIIGLSSRLIKYFYFLTR
ncbi:MAG: hypothetical protein CMC38_00550 [Flavobacteriaceae bacterium]|nr:hypothetical protein [Flavobacteriaceae bacterium]